MTAQAKDHLSQHQLGQDHPSQEQPGQDHPRQAQPHQDHRTLEKKISRRQFFERGLWLVGSIFSLLLGIPLLGCFLSALANTTSKQWVAVCPIDQIDSMVPNEFVVAFRGENAWIDYQEVRGVFVIRKGNDILAFTNVCTHMGCSVRWLDWRQQILCPCHGGMYDRWGTLMGGPPAHSLPFYESRIEEGILYVANRLIERV